MRTKTLRKMAVGACQMIPHLTGKFLPFSSMSAATLICQIWQNLAEIVKAYVVYVQCSMESVSVRQVKKGFSWFGGKGVQENVSYGYGSWGSNQTRQWSVRAWFMPKTQHPVFM